MANRHSIKLKNNESLYKVLSIVDSNDLPLNISAWTGSMQVRDVAASTELVADFSSFLTIDNQVGTVTIDVPLPTISGIPPGIYSYDLRITDPVQTFVLLEGGFTIEQGVTR